MARTSNKTKETARRILGQGEPEFSLLNSENSDLLHALNYYAVNKTYEDSKQYAIEWAVSNRPEIVSILYKTHHFDIANLGFVCRIIENGFSDSALEKKVEFYFDEIVRKFNLRTGEERQERQEKAAPKQIKKTIEPNGILETFDYAIDAVSIGESPEPIHYTGNKKHLDEVLYVATKIQNEVNEYPEQFKFQKDLKKFLKDVIDKINSTQKSVKASKAKKAAPKKVDPIKMTSKLVITRKDEALGIEGLKATAIIGASKLIVWHPERRTLTSYTATTPSGFLVSGRSVKNFDIEKSIVKRIRKPEEMWAAIKDMTATKMHIWLRDTCKTTSSPCKALIPDGSVILKV